jgi:hypothetical protein
MSACSVFAAEVSWLAKLSLSGWWDFVAFGVRKGIFALTGHLFSMCRGLREDAARRSGAFTTKT